MTGFGFTTKEKPIPDGPLRVLVCGDRHWNDRELIYAVLNTLAHNSPGIATIIEGDAPGADRIAGAWASIECFPYEQCPADWEFYGRAAGPIRNGTMLAKGKPDLVIAFHDDIDNSKGTKDMLKQARLAGVPCRVISHAEPELKL